MKRLVQLSALLLASALSLPALTTVTGTLTNASGTAYAGSFRLTWQTFMSGSTTIQGGFLNVTLASNGSFSVALEPNVGATPAGTSYRVDFDNIRNATRATEYWVVPTSGPVTQSAVRTIPPPTPSSIVTSLPNLIRVGTITTGVWNGTPITVPYGGTGATTLTGVVKGNGTSAFTVVSGTSTNCVLVDGTSAACGSGSGDVSGGTNLTTAGAVPYVSASGTLNQDATQLFWDATNNRLGLGTATPGMMLDLVDGQARFFTATGFGGGKGGVQTTANNSRGGVQFLNSAGSTRAEFIEDPSYGWRLSSAENEPINFGVNSATVGGFNTSGAFALGSGLDAALSRNAAGVVEINNGTPGTYRDIKIRTPQLTDNTEATCDSTTRGTFVMDQGGAGVADTLRVCRKDAADAYAWVPVF